jgi:hypothetical protein
VAVALAGSLALGGCGFTDAMVGIHDAPVENRSGAALDQESAGSIAARVLDAARAAQAEAGAKAEADQKAVLTGAALSVARAATATHSAAEAAAAPLTNPGAPKVLAVSKGKTWPRAILAATLDETANKQYLHVLVSASATDPFKLAFTVPMHGGAVVPALGDLAGGAPLVAANDGSGIIASPEAVLTQYAAGLGFPKPAPAPLVGSDDQFRVALRATAAAQAKSLGKLGKLTEVEAVVPGDTISFRLADGGTVTFGLLRRTDKITLAASAKELNLPTTYARLSGKKSVKKSVTVVSLDTVVLVVPPTGAAIATATGVGADEQIVSVTGR